MVNSLHRNHPTRKGLPPLVHAFIYTRVSSDEQAREGLSLEAQLADCRRYIAVKDWMIAGEYQDVMKGTRDDRPEYQRLLTDVRRLHAEGKHVIVVVKWLHRFGRKLLERIQRYQELKRLGVAVHSVAEGGEVPELVANMLAVIAEEEVRELGERVSSVRQHVNTTGWTFPGRTTWGYRFRPATEEERKAGAPKAVLDVDELAASAVREAYQRAASGISIRKVAKWIQSLPSETRGGRVMSYRAVRKTLSSPTYIARPPLGDDDVLARPVGKWPALVDDETWQRVQQRIAQHQNVPHQATGQYLLTGFLRCPSCGSRMCGNFHRRRGTATYGCNSMTTGARAPRIGCHRSITTHVIDRIVLAEVSHLIATFVATNPDDLQSEWLALTKAAENVDVVQEIRRAQRLAAQARERLKTAARLLVDGDLDKEGYELLRDEARADLDAAEAELSRLRSQQAPIVELPDLEEVLSTVTSWDQAIAEMPIPAQRDILAALVERIEPTQITRGKYTPGIIWTPLGEALRSVAMTRDAG